MTDPDAFDPGGAFRSTVAASLAADPYPTLQRLADNLGIPVEQVIHYALHRWASAGAEALMATTPQMLDDLRDAADRGDLEAVRGLLSVILAGYSAELR